jgi:hypothetical protein
MDRKWNTIKGKMKHRKLSWYTGDRLKRGRKRGDVKN